MRLLAVLAIIGFVAAPALADRPVPLTTVTGEAMGTPDSGLRTATDYSNMNLAGVINWSTTGTGHFSIDDYDGVETDNLLETFRFTGGVTAAGGVLFFEFYDTGGAYVDSFGVQLPYVGGYNWTITITTPFLVPADGFCQIWADNGIVVQPTTGIWYANINAPTIGTTGTAYPNLVSPLTGNHLDHKFEINFVPEPTTLIRRR